MATWSDRRAERPFRGCLRALAWCVALATGPAQVRAQDKPLIAAMPPTIHAWQVPPPQGAAQAYFTNLNNGDRIETPFVLRFGLAGGWGLAPISAPINGKSGHHHLLINRDLPLDFQKPLPFNEQYVHFGKGQMETVLNLAPGNYSLRLLLADHQHLPHFVYSKPVSVTVVKKNEVDAKTLVRKGIAVAVQAAAVKAPFRVQFHASGLNVGHAAQKEKDTGHFRLSLTPQPKGNAAEMEFSNGQTEVWLSPPTGDYTLKLEFIDNQNAARALAEPVTASLKVQ